MIAIYARVSTDAQAEKGTSLDTQLEACRKKAHELGFVDSVIQVYRDEGVSGADIDRAALNTLRSDIELGKIKEAVFCYDPDRLSRKLHYQLILEEQFNRYGVKLIFVNSNNDRETSEGRLLYQVQGVIAEYERDKIRERTVRGKLAKARLGQVMPMRSPPFGYRLVSGQLLIAEDEAYIVKKIYAWYIAGTSFRQIAAKLQEMGIQARLGSWNASTLRNMLQSETYLGRFWYNRRKRQKKDGKTKGGNPAVCFQPRPESEHILIPVPAIIEAEVWHRAQKRRENNKKFAKKNTRLDYLARGGYLRCADCGRVLQNTSYTSGHGELRKSVSIYRCPNLNPRNYSREKCPSSTVRAEILDSMIWSDLVEKLLMPDNAKYICKDKTELENGQIERQYVERALQQLDAEKERVLTLYRKHPELISLEDTEQQLWDIKQRQTQLTVQLGELLIHEGTNQGLKELEPKRIFNLIKSLLTTDRLAFEERRFVFEQMVDDLEVRIRPGSIELSYQGVFEMQKIHTYIPKSRGKWKGN